MMEEYPLYITGEEIIERLISRRYDDMMSANGTQIEYMVLFRFPFDALYLDEIPWLDDMGEVHWNNKTNVLTVELHYTDHHYM